jgi:hypothetical protein
MWSRKVFYYLFLGFENILDHLQLLPLRFFNMYRGKLQEDVSQIPAVTT